MNWQSWMIQFLAIASRNAQCPMTSKFIALGRSNARHATQHLFSFVSLIHNYFRFHYEWRRTCCLHYKSPHKILRRLTRYSRAWPTRSHRWLHQICFHRNLSKIEMFTWIHCDFEVKKGLAVVTNESLDRYHVFGSRAPTTNIHWVLYFFFFISSLTKSPSVELRCWISLD